MPTAAAQLTKILRDFNTRYRASLSAVVSRNGVPIAWALPADMRPDNLGTLTATILEASDVIYSGLNHDPPKRIILEAEKGTLIAIGVGPKAFLVAMIPGKVDTVTSALDQTVSSIRNLLQQEERATAR
ncbi:MAG: hypothetical protein E6K13_02825 [Methanobacteriota archaeon]|nr:MAG: hypothetical protein E6K13_02825 [Euryarchaeota archaeon]